MMAQKKILVVEDNHINRTMLCGILATEYEVLEAENGQQALELLKRYKAEISLILLDIVMPVMDGYTFLSIIKKDAAYASIPVIVTTQNDGESDEVSALSHGATDFVAKPYKPKIILHRVASIINLRETAAMINQFQYDRLTGLYSKEFFYQKVKETLLQNPDKAYDIVCSDIENFKLVNDVFGMPAGDRLLKGMAQAYLQIIGTRGLCGRFNADQFACLIEQRNDYEDAMFIDAVKLVEPYITSRSVVIKWGIYAVEDRAISVEQMCDRALLAARGIKGQYGKYFAVYDDTLRNKLLHEQAITDSMENALAQEQFEVYLQPKYRMDDGGLAGAEALVRWNHPDWGLQPPSEFIPLFEKSGFITKLDQFVWDRACAMLRNWEDKGYPPFPISVNVSRADIYNADLANALMHTVEKYKLPPYRLHLEITESAYTENPEQIIATVDHLRQLGFVVEMDDFGSGYSSLNMLNQMPLDILKLDRQFIESETAKPANQGILRFIMGIARSMNLGVVAEGVETKEQLERLREIGCDYVQGYYFAKPMPRDDFEQLIIQPKKKTERATRCAAAQTMQAILIADEDPQYRAKVAKTLEGRYQIIQTAEGNAALAYLASHEHTLAAMILSLTLPEEGGFAVLEALEREQAVWDLPVIATGPWDPMLEERALKGGADDYAGKPHLQSSLLRRVQHAMGVTALWERERALRDEAYRDYLTGLLNRRGLDCAVESLRQKDAPMAAYLFDLDDLKRVNDTFGHAEGDKLITAFGSLLCAHTRESDIVARFGGDEFFIVVKQMASEQTALQKGEEICQAIQTDPQAAKYQASVSAGLVLWDGKEPMGAVIQRTDEALYRAKTDRKGKCCLWRG